jgi:ABC-type bacteriocin/lantibiotic exporter with double-glycine peptidase domain
VILTNLSTKGKSFWFASLLIGVIASVLEVASAAVFSLLTSVLFGGQKSNFGVLGGILPFSITQAVLISSLGVVFLLKLISQWIELNLKTKSAEDFYTSIFHKKAYLSQKEIENSQAPITNLANRMHFITHNIYYPAGLIISESLMMIFLVPFVVYISPKGSLLVFGTTLILSIPLLRFVRKRLTLLNEIRTRIDTEADFETYLDFRSYFDQGRLRTNSTKLRKQIHSASEIDRKIVKTGSYSRLTIELSFIVSVVLTFSFIDKLVAAEARIQFFAVLAYSFFRIIPAFTRIVTARNQIASYQSEFLELATIEIPTSILENSKPHSTFQQTLTLSPSTCTDKPDLEEISFNMGDFVLVRGETGVGKTTLLKNIGGLQNASYKVFVDGNEIIDPQTWRPSVALVSQSPFLFGQNLVEMITGEQSNTNIDGDLYADALRISCLESWGVARFDQLTNENISGGERKQIALARAIYLKPEILLLDEVTAGMDRVLADQILGNIRACTQFKLIAIASHDPLHVENSDRVVNLK